MTNNILCKVFGNVQINFLKLPLQINLNFLNYQSKNRFIEKCITFISTILYILFVFVPNKILLNVVQGQ